MTLREEVEILREREEALKKSNGQRKDRIKEQSTEITELHTQLTERDAVIKELTQSNVALENALKARTTQREKLRKELVQAREENQKSQEAGDLEEEEEDELPDAIHDGLVYCCSECGFEIVDGYCQSCLTEHNWNEEMGKDTIPTENEALVQDRQLRPRGTTPMREVGTPNIHRDYRGSDARSEEYLELLRRGATRFMCETFNLEFSPATGIVAWADPSLYEAFAGPAMQKGDFWKIHLGRRIELDDDDLDGSQFLEDFIEDALLFPLRSDLSNRTHERWETVEESPGIWVTRPMASPDVQDDGADDDENSDSGDLGDGEDAVRDAWAKLEMREWVYQPSNAVRPDDYDADEDEADELEADELGMKVEDEAQGDLDSDVQMSDPGWSFDPRQPDAPWPTVLNYEGDDSDVMVDVVPVKGAEGEEKADGVNLKGAEGEDGVNLKGAEGEEKADGVNLDGHEEEEKDEDREEYGNMAVSDFEESDSADSDFDSDEVLSGDEIKPRIIN